MKLLNKKKKTIYARKVKRKSDYANVKKLSYGFEKDVSMFLRL